MIWYRGYRNGGGVPIHCATGTGVSTCVLVAGTGRDVPALSRPVPGFSNDRWTIDKLYRLSMVGRNGNGNGTVVSIERTGTEVQRQLNGN